MSSARSSEWLGGCESEQDLRLAGAHERGADSETRARAEEANEAPAGRALEGPDGGDVVALHRVGGLRHRYSRAA